MPLPDYMLQFLNILGLIFGSFILFAWAVRLIRGGSVNVPLLFFVCAVVAWCVVCLIN